MFDIIDRQHPRIFSDLAHLWPLLSPPEQYAPEAATLDRILGELLCISTERPRLLELGAGGGHTIFHLRDRYEITAVDLSDEMLACCRRLNPGVEALTGDMRNLRLGRVFDAVLIHDAVDYLVERSEVESALATAAAHLETGGVTLVAPTYVAETFVEHDVEYDSHGDEECSLTYFSYVHHPGSEPTRVENVLVYLIRDANGRVEIVEDRHICGLFSTAAWLEMIASAGFSVGQDYLIHPSEDGSSGVPMFVGIRE